MRIIPMPKHLVVGKGRISVGRILRVCYPDGMRQRLEPMLALLLPGVEITPSERSRANLLLCSDCADLRSEHYRINAVADTVVLSFSDFLGARNAVATLAQTVAVEDGQIYVPMMEIEDKPDAAFRSFMHDVGRKYVPLEELKLHLLTMAKFKMNVLHFHFSEYVGFGVALSGFSQLRGPGLQQYTEDEIRELVAFANTLGIDVIPEIDIPGHANAITDAYPRTACDPLHGAPGSGWAMCVGSEETYVLLERMIGRAAELFGSRYFHIGGDEISMTDLDRSPKPVADWLRCRRCRALMERENIASEVELFYYFLRRVYSIVKGLGKQLIIWNDWIDISTSPDIPRDIIIEFWRVAAPERGPCVGCSMQRFLDEGFTVINAHYPDTYIDLYADYGRLKEWRYDRFPADAEGTAGSIIGADVPAWDVHPHYAQSIPVSIVLYGDKLWGAESDWGEDFLPAVSRLLIGTDGVCLFDYTKNVIILDDENDIWRVDADRDALRAELERVVTKDPLISYCVKTYLRLLD